MNRPSLTVFTMLVQQYHPILHRFARFIIKDDEAAEHVASEALISSWNLRAILTTGDEIHNYLKRITRTLCHDWLYTQALEYRKQTPPHPTLSTSGEGEVKFRAK